MMSADTPPALWQARAPTCLTTTSKNGALVQAEVRDRPDPTDHRASNNDGDSGVHTHHG
eukprot:CAMPEP_0177327160 /NCGR_PEP_ID=MMETSP0368-20130122/18741_1 /TAXON_ID=447022 ORGANISM="Scrippsiella hangoei-like, Strain SHHI-4" /NCGR_SAMPLE_ID=MMETSP0368 /ASSEMBLY_ACC=CAM_ASM_000363 /LENGTH=58 /DNA_ID=CAMNT_0018787201 /DNA_START=225 /DNA_END=398 /DNA_ORIENTATION=+